MVIIIYNCECERIGEIIKERTRRTRIINVIFIYTCHAERQKDRKIKIWFLIY